MAPLLSLLVLFVVWAGRTGNADLGIELAAEEAAAAGVMAAESFCLPEDPAKPDDPLSKADERRRCVDEVVAQVLESHPATWACLGGARGAAEPADGSDHPFLVDVDKASGAVIVRVECDSDVAVAAVCTSNC